MLLGYSNTHTHTHTHTHTYALISTHKPIHRYTHTHTYTYLVWFGLVWFGSISTIGGYSMPNPVYAYTLDIYAL